ncbi:MAG TPA: SH3 domain-containing protein, partial [Clostridia bacterium]|nr:SH3 domain-containing protein [Clostridia bacterium]
PSESLTDPDLGDEDSNPSIQTPDLVYAIADPVNLYASPDLGSELVHSVSSGDSLIKLAQVEDWFLVQIRPGLEGYVKDSQVSKDRVFVPKTGESYYVQNRQVYVRSGPGTEYPIEGFALRGMSVKVLEAGKDWSRIRTEHGLTGYMFNELFGPNKPADEITELERGRYMYVDTEEANLRESPSTDSPIIGAAFMDDRVYQISDNGGWSRIRTEWGVEAYVFNHLLRETPPANPFIQTNRRLYVAAESVNVRSSPTVDASVLTSLKRDAAVTELEANDTWSKVRLEDSSIGFIRSDLLTRTTPPPSGFTRSSGTLYVTTGAANIRSEPNTSSSVVVVVRHGDKLTKKAVGPSWTMIETSAGKTGYISNDLVSANKPAANQGGSSGGSSGGSTGGSSGSSGNSANSDLRQRVVDIARSALGTPYRLGGKTMSAFDCSGLVKYAYEAIGYRNIAHGSDPQARQLGTRVNFSGRDFSNLLPGDLIFFSRGYGYHHVGIYVGNNQMVHAVSGRGVVLDNLLTYPLAARVNRVLD